MAELKIKADSGGGTVSFKGPATTTSNAAVQLTLPVDDGTANQYLKTDGGGALSWDTVAVGGAAGTGYNDNVKISLGTGNDAEFYFSGTDNYFNVKTGKTFIRTGDEVRIQNDAETETIAKFIKDDGCYLYFNDSTKLSTTNIGVSITGSITPSSGMYVGGAGGGNHLDDYEKGTWTPTAGSGSDIALNNPVGVYTKIGNVVHVQCYFSSTSAGTMAVNDQIEVEGLPFSRDSNVIPPAMIQINYNSTNGSIIRGCTVNTTPAITGRIGVTTGHNRSGPGYQVSATYRVA